jgi:pimeloyl-ACP methyl ester carboxylesterase
VRRRVSSVFAAVAACGLALLGAPAAHAAPAAPAGAPAAPAYQPPPVAWGACTSAALKQANAQCGVVVVPLDYANPKGATIKLAVSRVKHSVPDAQYQGPMLVNPGGPGGSGLVLSLLGRNVPTGAGAAYDWIGFDPRGVGASVPALTCQPQYAGYDRPDYDPAKSPSATGAWLARSKAYAQACAKNGPILQHMTTLDAVRDMDSIRLALGAKQINYYGFSYGTYLGQVYATEYPQNLRRAVFDGVVRASGVWYADNIDQDHAFQKTIEVFFDWVAKHDVVYHLGTTGPDVEKLYYATQDKLRTAPAAGKIGPAEWNDIFLQAGYYVFGWQDIASVFSRYVKQNDTASLVALYNQTNTVDNDNGYAVYLGVQCTDTAWPPVDTALADNTRVAAEAPFETWANGWFNAPCAFWPAKAQTPVTVDGSKAGPVLMINETLDAATPYDGALEARASFPRSALVEGVGGTTHAGSLNGVACTDSTIATFLSTGALPARVAGNRSDKQCPPVPQPNPTGLATLKAPAPGGSQGG